MRGMWRHAWTTIVLNCRNRQALIFGYVVPVLFLIGFVAIFGSNKGQMGKTIAPLLVISVLGGACFGMPINLVHERDRGVWRRYRLTPLGASTFITSTIMSRIVLITSSVILQIALAMWIYGLPWPQQPLMAVVAIFLTMLVFIGIGLIIAALANSIGAVQAMGQSLFLPMIMIGGVGVPYRLLPGWAQDFSLFLPGRYAMELIERCYTHDTLGLQGPSRMVTLCFFALSALLAGWKLFRWEAEERLRPSAYGWVAMALLAWIIAGVVYKVFPTWVGNS